MSFNYLQSYVKMPVSAWCYIHTSLPQEPSSILYYLMLNSGIGHLEASSQPCEKGFVRYMPSPFYPSSVVLFQLHGGMVSHMQVLATQYNTIFLDSYLWNHTSFSCLFLRQWCRDVASGADRHLDIGLQVVEAHPLCPYFLEKRLAIPTSPFFIY